jgi:myo-inositol-1-phosphate synthase
VTYPDPPAAARSAGAPEPIGLWLVGARGNVATVVAVAQAAIARGIAPPVGMATASAALRDVALAPLDAIRLGGHDIGDRGVVDTARALAATDRLFDPTLVDAVAGELAALEREIRPGVTALSADDRDGAARLAAIQRDLRAFADAHRLARVVVVNVASTESPLAAPLPATAAGLAAAVRDGGVAVPASVLYAYAALDLGFGYVNFTPSTGSSIPALEELAVARGAVHAGRDGKTGETLLKSALAPMFAVRNLRVLSWFGQNILGNPDGLTLTDPAHRGSKERSKASVVPSILGYAPEAPVRIDYVGALGDWKIAWDHILFEGLLGSRMSLQLVWQGADSILAAPLVLDLARLVDRALARGETGALAHLAVFFKDPLGSDEHRLERQWAMLLEHLGVDPR